MEEASGEFHPFTRKTDEDKDDDEDEMDQDITKQTNRDKRYP